MIVSFHPIYEADKNLLCAGRDPGKEELAAMESARAVVLPQGCRKTLYTMARNNCRHVFPNYDARFEFPEKIGQARLFRKMNVPHPATITYLSLADFRKSKKYPAVAAPFDYPLVLKFDWGGEGDNVSLVPDADALVCLLEKAKSYEKTGQYGFVLQEFIPSGGVSLRVVVIHTTYISYWRRQDKRNSFHTNLKRGARIDADSQPRLQKAAINAAKSFCKKTGINLAGFDFLFSEKTLESDLVEPLFLEINYFFGRRGLGGSNEYYKILQAEIDGWLKTVTS